MKALKIILMIVGVLVALILIIPLFSPATAEVSAETDIDVEPARIFPVVASFTDRQTWDPWVTQDSTAKVSIHSESGYVGSTYTWDGERLGTGKMQVIAVDENRHIESSLWFGEAESPALVQWSFEPVEGGTHVVWSFTQKTAWPIERLGMMFGKIFLKQSFTLGLSNLKEYIESRPQPVSSLGDIGVETQQAFNAMVADGAGSMETISEELGRLYGLVYAEVERQGLQVSGPAFALYTDYDEATGFSRYRVGFMVDRAGEDAGEVMAKEYPEMSVVQARHTGPYEGFSTSYDKMDQYIRSNDLEITGEAFEFYITGAMTESDQNRWETLIAFPLKQDGPERN